MSMRVAEQRSSVRLRTGHCRRRALPRALRRRANTSRKRLRQPSLVISPPGNVTALEHDGKLDLFIGESATVMQLAVHAGMFTVDTLEASNAVSSAFVSAGERIASVDSQQNLFQVWDSTFNLVAATTVDGSSLLRLDDGRMRSDAVRARLRQLRGFAIRAIQPRRKRASRTWHG